MKVFVSSTYEDLQDHRKAVDNILNRLAAQFRGMEVFGSRPLEPKKMCLEEISSCDILIGIYAHRYGWIPEGDQLSITEQEFDYAQLLGKPCYCYVVDPNHPWNPRHVEFSAKQNLERFREKINKLVRSQFTTPDNLAKQVAADLVAAFTQLKPSRGAEDTMGCLQMCATHEILTTIGAKYVRTLYVDRQLDQSLESHLRQASEITAFLAKLCEAIRNLLSELRSQRETLSQESVAEVEYGLVGSYSTLSALSKLPAAMDKRLLYPSNDILQSITDVQALAARFQREVIRSESNQAVVRTFSAHIQRITGCIKDLDRLFRPVYLIVARAGSGKTNVLCHLTESLGRAIPILFTAAKVIPDSSEDGFMRYIASVYPFDSDPIEKALEVAASKGIYCIVIIDGINEHFDPRLFNALLKALVRRYYERPIKFLLSCRDLYWQYFKDTWWDEHAFVLEDDGLYSFSISEYTRALPLYLKAFDIEVDPVGNAQRALRHPLLLRFFCEAFRGTPLRRTRMGKLSELRLIELFDTYCERKFEQIRARLGLVDSEEIFLFLKMIASKMLVDETRSISTEVIGKEAFTNFGERSIRRLDSRYIQILDEDILIEERPAGDLSSRVVSFVYEEFMEYMMARTLWFDNILAGDEEEAVLTILPQIDKMIAIRRRFVPGSGILLYLGEMFAQVSESCILRYLAELERRFLAELVITLAERICLFQPNLNIFSIITNLHVNGARRIRYRAWRAIELLAPLHWRGVNSYLSVNRGDREVGAEIALVFLRQLVAKLRPDEQHEALRLVRDAMLTNSTNINLISDIDFATGRNTARIIFEYARPRWTRDQTAAAEEWLDEVEWKFRTKVKRLSQ